MRQLMQMLLIGLLAGCAHAHFEIGIEPPATPTVQVTATQSPVIETPTIAATSTTAGIAFSTSTATIAPTATRRPVVRATLTPIEPSPTPTLPLTRIISFTVDPSEVDPGQVVTLRWSTTKADRVDIFQFTPDTVPYSGTVGLPPGGEITQTILARERQWHLFELSAGNEAGVVTQTVKVSIRCPDAYFFSPLPAIDQEMWDCPDGPAVSSNAAEQVFENGLMLWLEHDDRIYVC